MAKNSPTSFEKKFMAQTGQSYASYKSKKKKAEAELEAAKAELSKLTGGPDLSPRGRQIQEDATVNKYQPKTMQLDLGTKMQTTTMATPRADGYAYSRQKELLDEAAARVVASEDTDTFSKNLNEYIDREEKLAGVINRRNDAVVDEVLRTGVLSPLYEDKNAKVAKPRTEEEIQAEIDAGADALYEAQMAALDNQRMPMFAADASGTTSEAQTKAEETLAPLQQERAKLDQELQETIARNNEEIRQKQKAQLEALSQQYTRQNAKGVTAMEVEKATGADARLIRALEDPSAYNIMLAENGDIENPRTLTLAFMTDEERKVALSFAKQGDYEHLNEYMELVETDAAERRVTQMTDRLEAFAKKNPHLAVVLRSLAQYANAGALTATALQTVKNRITGENESLDRNGWAFTAAQFRDATMRGVLSHHRNVKSPGAAWFAQVGMSLSDNIATLPLAFLTGGSSVGANIALAVMGMNAASDRAYQLAGEGISSDKILAVAAMAGAIEVATEKMGLDNLMSIVKKGGTALYKGMSKEAVKAFITDALTQVGGQMAAEASEELIAEIAGNIVSNAILGNESEMYKYIDELVAQGYSRKDAEQEAFMKFYIYDALLAAAGGALSGLALSGGSVIATGLKNGATQKQKELAGTRLINDGLQFAEGSRTRAIAQELETRLAKTEKHDFATAGITDSDIDALRTAILADIGTEAAPSNLTQAEKVNVIRALDPNATVLDSPYTQRLYTEAGMDIKTAGVTSRVLESVQHGVATEAEINSLSLTKPEVRALVHEVTGVTADTTLSNREQISAARQALRDANKAAKEMLAQQIAAREAVAQVGPELAARAEAPAVQEQANAIIEEADRSATVQANVLNNGALYFAEGGAVSMQEAMEGLQRNGMSREEAAGLIIQWGSMNAIPQSDGQPTPVPGSFASYLTNPTDNGTAVNTETEGGKTDGGRVLHGESRGESRESTRRQTGDVLREGSRSREAADGIQARSAVDSRSIGDPNGDPTYKNLREYTEEEIGESRELSRMLRKVEKSGAKLRLFNTNGRGFAVRSKDGKTRRFAYSMVLPGTNTICMAVDVGTAKQRSGWLEHEIFHTLRLDDSGIDLLWESLSLSKQDEATLRNYYEETYQGLGDPRVEALADIYGGISETSVDVEQYTAKLRDNAWLLTDRENVKSWHVNDAATAYKALAPEDVPVTQTDNVGRVLTPQQDEYFEKSYVREGVTVDAKSAPRGPLLVMYRGTALGKQRFGGAGKGLQFWASLYEVAYSYTKGMRFTDDPSAQQELATLEAKRRSVADNSPQARMLDAQLRRARRKYGRAGGHLYNVEKEVGINEPKMPAKSLAAWQDFLKNNTLPEYGAAISGSKRTIVDVAKTDPTSVKTEEFLPLVEKSRELVAQAYQDFRAWAQSSETIEELDEWGNDDLRDALAETEEILETASYQPDSTDMEDIYDCIDALREVSPAISRANSAWYDAMYESNKFLRELADQIESLDTNALASAARVMQNMKVDSVYEMRYNDGTSTVFASEGQLIVSLESAWKDDPNNSYGVYEGYLNLKKPYIVDAEGNWYDQIPMKPEFREYVTRTQQQATKALADMPTFDDWSEMDAMADAAMADFETDVVEQGARLRYIAEWAQSTGLYDGVICLNAKDTYTRHSLVGDVRGVICVTWLANSVKSTTNEAPTSSDLAAYKLAPRSDHLQNVIDRLSANESVTDEELMRVPEIEREQRKVEQVKAAQQAEAEAAKREGRKLPKYDRALADEVTPVAEREIGFYNGKNPDGSDRFGGFPVAADSIAHLVIGPPGAGKSSVVVNKLSAEYRARLVDTDEVVGIIRRIRNRLTDANVSDLQGTGREVKSRMAANALQNRENIVWPLVGTINAKDSGELNYADTSWIKKVADMRHKGYKVYLHFVDIPANVSKGRAMARAFPEDGSVGRFIDLEYLNQATSMPVLAYEYLTKEGLVDGYARYDNFVPRGEPARVIESAGVPSVGERGLSNRTAEEAEPGRGASIGIRENGVSGEYQAENRPGSDETAGLSGVRLSELERGRVPDISGGRTGRVSADVVQEPDAGRVREDLDNAGLAHGIPQTPAGERAGVRGTDAGTAYKLNPDISPIDNNGVVIPPAMAEYMAGSFMREDVSVDSSPTNRPTGPLIVMYRGAGYGKIQFGGEGKGIQFWTSDPRVSATYNGWLENSTDSTIPALFDRYRSKAVRKTDTGVPQNVADIGKFLRKRTSPYNVTFGSYEGLYMDAVRLSDREAVEEFKRNVEAWANAYLEGGTEALRITYNEANTWGEVQTFETTDPELNILDLPGMRGMEAYLVFDENGDFGSGGGQMTLALFDPTIDETPAKDVSLFIERVERELYEVYLNLTNPYIVDAQGNSYNRLTPIPGMQVNGREYVRTREIADFIRAGGEYDGLIVLNVRDDADGTGEPSTVAVTWKPESAKSTANENPTDDPRAAYKLSDTTEYAPTFYSQMANVVEGVKQEKLGAASVVNMLRGKGVKAEEIKWSGIEEFLDGKKSVTKQELLDFIRGNQLVIEESVRDVSKENVKLKKLSKNSKGLYVNGELTETFTQDEDGAWWPSNPKDQTDYYVSENHILDEYVENLDVGTKWSEYTVKGGKNYRELIFKLPGSTYSNDAMKGHWGQNAEGILAHARVQDFKVDGKNILFIEEIQSDWHNAGHKTGYNAKGVKTDVDLSNESADAYHEFNNSEISKGIKNRIRSNGYPSFVARLFLDIFDGKQFAYDELNELAGPLTDEERAYIESVASAERQRQKAMETAPAATAVPDAPFRSNYHEYVLKSLIRAAAENGYDSIGWTTGKMQENRWSDEFAEGYRIEYDQDIPKFLNKYGKKWGAEVGTTKLKSGDEVWTMPITEEMKQSVLYEGQPMYKLSNDVADTETTEYAEGSYQDRLLQLVQAQNLEAVKNVLEAWSADITAQNPDLARNRANTPMFGEVFNPNYTPVTEEQIEKNRAALTALIAQYGQLPVGENASRDVAFPEQVNDRRKVRRFVRTAAESENVPEYIVPSIEREVADGTLAATYVPKSDKAAMRAAENDMKRRGYNVLLREWNSLMETRSFPSKGDIARGELLLIEAAKAGDAALTMKLIADVASAGTQAGQVVQAMSLLKKMSPAGQLYYLQRAVDRMNLRYRRRIDRGRMGRITIDPKDATPVLTAKTQTELETAIENLKQKIADQVPVTLNDKWNAWRYLSMLGNVRTHARNFVGNAVFMPIRFMKEVLATVGEQALPEEQRTKSFRQLLTRMTFGAVHDAYDDFAKSYYALDKETMLGTGKYNIDDGIQSKRKIWKSKAFGWLNAVSEFNDKALSGEDAVFLKSAYSNALAGYLRAKKLNLAEATKTKEGLKIIEAARQYAMTEAQKATYRDASKIAKFLNRGKEIRGLNVLLDGLMPFTTTPINILKRGVEYSPVGLMKTIVADSIRLKNGSIDANQFIDNLAAGMTGTMVAGLGILLSWLGVLRFGGGEDEAKSALESTQGYQDFSITLGNKSYTIDWSAPVSLPLFTGAAVMDTFKRNQEWSLGAVVDALTLIAEPMFSLSMLDGLNKAISSSGYEDNPLTAVAMSTVQSYLGQAVPTLAGQISRIFDDTSRTTYIDKNRDIPTSISRFIQSSVQAKTPGWENQRAARINVWGREESSGSFAYRLFENLISPGYGSTINETDMERELTRLYDATGDTGVLPKAAPKDFKVNGADKFLTQDEYEVFAKARGQTAEYILTAVTNSEAYEAMTDKEKSDVVQKAFDYADQTAKLLVAPDYAVDNWVLDGERVIENDGAIEDYVLAQIIGAAGGSSYENILANEYLSMESKGAALASERNWEKTFTDPNKSGYEYTLTTEQQNEMADIYYGLFMEEWEDLSSRESFVNATPEKQEEKLSKIRTELYEKTRKQMAKNLKAAGVKSTKKD